MTRVSIYIAEQHDYLLYLRGAVGAEDGQTTIIRLLVDTGARRTVLPLRLLTAFGLDVTSPIKTVQVTAAGGILQIPLFVVPWFSCLGYRLENFEVLGLNLPQTAKVDGLLGMDFLTQANAIIDIVAAEIRVPDQNI